MSTAINKKHAPAAVSRNVAALDAVDRNWPTVHFDFRRPRERPASTDSIARIKQTGHGDGHVMYASEVTEADCSDGAVSWDERHAPLSFTPPKLPVVHGNPARPDAGQAIFKTDRLDRRCIDRLVSREVLAVKVSGFVSRSQALDIGGQLMDCAPYRGFDGEAAGHLGMPFHEALTRPDLVDAYFTQALSSIAAVRKCCEPYASPVDTLRCMLDEIWPAGAHLYSVDGRKMVAGLPNVLPPDVCIQTQCHAVRALPVYGQLRNLLVCNICLSTPQDDGELLIWERGALAPEVLAVLREAEQDIDPILLGKPSLKVRLEPGELILFDARQPYAVNDGKGSPRMSLSLFVGYRGENAPLTYWS